MSNNNLLMLIDFALPLGLKYATAPKIIIAQIVMSNLPAKSLLTRAAKLNIHRGISKEQHMLAKTFETRDGSLQNKVRSGPGH